MFGRLLLAAGRAGRPASVAFVGVGVAAAWSGTSTHCGWFSSKSSSSAVPKGAPVPPFTLQYFPVPATPGEIIRLLLMLGDKEWKDEKVPGTAWAKLKPNTKFGMMPILSGADGGELIQSRAIARYLARDVAIEGALLYPSADAWLCFQVDEAVDSLEDVRLAIIPTFAAKDQAEKERLRAALFATDGSGKLFEGLKKLEKQLPGDGHMVGGVFTLADAWAFSVVNTYRAGFLDGVPLEGWIDELPKLKAVVDKVAAVPQIKAYYAPKAADSKLYAYFVPR